MADRRLEVHPTHPEPRKIRQAVEVLRDDGVIVYPTDTVYGLGCDVSNKRAVERVYQLKRMPEDHLVAFVCADLGDIARYAVVDDRAYRVMRRLLPGPYTFILQATRDAPRTVMQKKRKTVGIRIPNHPVSLALVKELGSPIVSTSAVLEGEVIQDPDELMKRFARADLVLDSGWGGLETSTVVDLSGAAVVVVREGAGPVDAL
jgi:tRNA threonylcarbamoyl adenosine modification protein (Sua5/YciO/YrdC/YwlC family)